MMAGGSNELRECVARIEALIGAVPEIEDDKPLLDKVADLKSLIEKWNHLFLLICQKFTRIILIYAKSLPCYQGGEHCW